MSAKWDRLIAVLEIVGGGLGIVLTIIAGGRFLGSLLEHQSLLLIFGLSLFLYVLSLIAGLFLWKNHPIGFTLSLLVQALQVPQFTIAEMSYRFVVGLDFVLMVGSNDFNLNFSLGSEWFFGSPMQSNASAVGLNFVALFVLVYLFKRRKITRQRSMRAA